MIYWSDVMKKDFVVTRSITEIEGKPHVETISEAELVRCKDCKHWSKDEKEEVDGKEIRPCENGLYPEWHSGEWFCKGGERT